jgi:hypothetical protein
MLGLAYRDRKLAGVFVRFRRFQQSIGGESLHPPAKKLQNLVTRGLAERRREYRGLDAKRSVTILRSKDA